jgi:hypothetical protein
MQSVALGKHTACQGTLCHETRTQEDTANLATLGLEVELHVITPACHICPVVGASS